MTRKNITLFFLLFILIIPIAAQTNNFCLKGTIIDHKYNIPIRNVAVELSSICGQSLIDTTDSYGKYYFDSVSLCDNYTIKCFRGPYNCDKGYFPIKAKFTKLNLDTLKTIYLYPTESHTRIPIIYFNENSIDYNEILINSYDDSLYVDTSYNYSLTNELKEFAEFVNCNHKYNILLVTSSSSKEFEQDKNFELSKKRAEKVKNSLISLGVNPKLIKTQIFNKQSLKYNDTDIEKTKEKGQQRLKTISNQSVFIRLTFRCE